MRNVEDTVTITNTKLKIFLGGQRFSTTEELTAEVEGYFAGLEKSRHWNITGPNALFYRETVLKNENISTKVRHFFLVHSENFSNNPRINTE